MAPEVDKAISEESWTASAKAEERYWWIIDLGGEVEEPEVGSRWTITKGNSMNPEGEMYLQPDGKKRLQLKKRKVWQY